MTSSFVARRIRRAGRVVIPFLFLLPWTCEQLVAKTVGLTAIEVYPSGSGVSYEQITGFILNGKNEVLLCADAAQLDKSAYHKLTKVVLAPGMTLERNEAGVLMLTQESGTPACVIPGNLKLEKGEGLTPSNLADKALIEGVVLPASDPVQSQIPPLKAGVKIVFVTAPSQELAEFLRAEKTGTIPGWEFFLKSWDGSAQAAAAKKALSQLYIQSASSDFAEYQASKSKDPQYGKLKDARELTEKAKNLIPDDKGAIALSDKVHAEVIDISKAALQKLGLYRAAIENKQAGYSNLPDAEKLAQSALQIEPGSSNANEAAKQVREARDSFDRTLSDVAGKIAAKQPDEAAAKLQALECFSKEVPRISDDLSAISLLYLDRARRDEGAEKWSDAVSDLTRANEVVPSQATGTLLADAKQKEHAAEVKSAADLAMQKSAAFEGSGDIINAFEVVDDLPKESRDLVAQRIADLQEKYVTAAEAAAQNLQKAHEPINGLTDEIGIQSAYEYLQRCFRLTNDPSLRDRISVLADDLSGYYLQQGKRYTNKPDGIGANVGWVYLNESLQYRSQTNASAAHDALASATPEHLLKSKLSVRVDFRDGTSRREGAQFADQLEEALASGLESSGLHVKIVHKEQTPVPPNYQLIGDVLEHSKSSLTQNIPKQSKYIAGEQQVPNEAWAALSREVDKVNRQLDTDRSQLQGAEARGKKKEIADAKSAIDQDNASVEKLQAKLDTIPKTLSQPVTRDYTYTEVVHKVVVTVDLQFHILDSSGTEVIPRLQIHRESPTSYTVFENVKSEDSMGVKNESVIPDENKFFELTEYAARDELIADARKKIAELPAIVFAAAERKATNGDSDGAAELYILYLNCTPVAETPERSKAQKYLADQFNFKNIGNMRGED
jgi:hypothetical protein